MENLQQFTNKLYALSETDFLAFKKLFEPISIKKMDHLFSEGEKVEDLFFISKGFLRGYYIKEGEEFTTDFFYGPALVTDIFSIRNNLRTYYNVQVVKESVCYKANFNAMELLMESHPEIRVFMIKFYEFIYMRAVDRKTSFLYDSQKERYLKLMSFQPELFTDIPLQYIASYLAIKPETLSRIRRKI